MDMWVFDPYSPPLYGLLIKKNTLIILLMKLLMVLFDR